MNVQIWIHKCLANVCVLIEIEYFTFSAANKRFLNDCSRRETRAIIAIMLELNNKPTCSEKMREDNIP